ncbi:MAG TPA: alcohol dehydrogenase, partial [Clostridiales bacterium]|nr:alcohol dehydrogenase [Clostridiales bacterium]
MSLLKKLAETGRRYGGDGAYAPAGHGSASFKKDGTLYIKYADTQLSELTEYGFIAMDAERLAKIAETEYADMDAQLADIRAAVLPLQRSGMPSTECVLHSMFPQNYVLHLHPALVNGMVCGEGGKKLAGELFPQAAWAPFALPGSELAKAVKAALSAFENVPDTLFLQNQGVVVAADSVEELDEVVSKVMQTLKDMCIVNKAHSIV